MLLLGVELGLRSFGLVEQVGLAALHDYSESYGWAPRPGARFVTEHGPTSINAKGYRGRLVAPQPPPGVKRVVLLGDSIAFGTDVVDQQTFAHLLDSPSAGLEIVNLAVEGYGLDQELLLLEREGLAYAPALVVLNVCLDNDLADIGLAYFLYDGEHPKPYFTLEQGELVLHEDQLKRSSWARLGDELRRRSQLYVWLSQWASPQRADAPAEAAAEHWTARKTRALRDPQAQPLSVELVRRMQAAAAGHGAGFLVVLHPDKASFRDGSPWIDALREAPALAGTNVLDLRQAYLAQGARWQDITLDPIGHLSPEGHRLAASILADVLRQAPRPLQPGQIR